MLEKKYISIFHFSFFIFHDQSVKLTCWTNSVGSGEDCSCSSTVDASTIVGWRLLSEFIDTCNVTNVTFWIDCLSDWAQVCCIEEIN